MFCDLLLVLLVIAVVVVVAEFVAVSVVFTAPVVATGVDSDAVVLTVDVAVAANNSVIVA